MFRSKGECGNFAVHQFHSAWRVTIRKQAPSPRWHWPAMTLYLPLLQRICSHQPSFVRFGLVNCQEWHCHYQNVCNV